MPPAILDFHLLTGQLTELSNLPESPGFKNLNFDYLLEAEDQLCEALSYLRSLQTTHVSAASRLPPEILVNIFRLLFHDRDFSLPLFIRPSLRPWFNIIGACRYWRRAALAAPDLWCQINLSETSADDTCGGVFFDRSQFLSPIRLHIKYDVPISTDEGVGNIPFDPPRTVLKALENPSRIEEFLLETQSAYKSAFCELLQKPAPLLRSLSLCFWLPRGPHLPTIDLPCIFDDQYPCLENLCLFGVSSWPSNTFKNLTRFSLFHVPGKLLAISDFLAFLSASPNLQDLRVNYGVSTLTTWGKVYTPVALPNLQYLEFGEEVLGRGVSRILSNLILSQTLERWLWHLHNRYPEQSLVHGFYSHPLERERIGHLKRVVHSDYPSIRSRGWTSGHFLGTIRGDTLLMNGAGGSHDLKVPEQLGYYSGVIELIWTVQGNWGELSGGVFSLFPALRYCSVSGMTWSDMKWYPFAALKRSNRYWDTDEVEHVPLLEYLHITPLDPPTTEKGLGTLVRLIRARKRLGSPLKTLVVEGFREDMMDLLWDEFGRDVVKSQPTRDMRPDDIKALWLQRHLTF